MNTMFLHVRTLCLIFASLLGLLIGPSSLFANLKEDIDSLQSMLAANQLVEARPLMDSLRGEVEPQVVANLDFFYALSYVFEYYESNNVAVLDTAKAKFEAFLSSYSTHDLAGLARYNLADVNAISGDFKEALTLYISLYRNPVKGVDRKDVLKKVVLIYAAEEEWEACLLYTSDAADE